jgi:phenylacetate-CoA ligase
MVTNTLWKIPRWFLNGLKSHILYPIAENQEKRDISNKLIEIKKYNKIPYSQRKYILQDRMFKILNYSAHQVPYYRDLFKKIQFDPKKILKDLKFIEDIPLLNKEIVSEQGQRLLSEEILNSKTHLHQRKTGGSTGPSTLIYYNQEALDYTAAANILVLEWTGKSKFDLEIHLSTQFFQHIPFKEIWREKIKCWAMNRVNVYTHALDDDGLYGVWKKIYSIKPYLIQGHPSTLYALSCFVMKNSFPSKGVINVIESTGESLDEKKRLYIEGVFGVKVFNRYGNAEFGVISHSESKSLNPQFTRVVDFMVYPENHHDEIVITGLTNFAMPLIRYQTGDLGEVKFNEFSGHFQIDKIQGRVHDLIPIHQRLYPTHYLQDVLDRFGGVNEFQVILDKAQNKVHSIKIVPTSESNQEAIIQRMNELFGVNQVKVEFTDFSGLIYQGWREKFRYVAYES